MERKQTTWEPPLIFSFVSGRRRRLKSLRSLCLWEGWESLEPRVASAILGDVSSGTAPGPQTPYETRLTGKVRQGEEGPTHCLRGPKKRKREAGADIGVLAVNLIGGKGRKGALGECTPDVWDLPHASLPWRLK